MSLLIDSARYNVGRKGNISCPTSTSATKSSLRLNPYEFLVYVYLVSCAGKQGKCWSSTNTIARVFGMRQSTVLSRDDGKEPKIRTNLGHN